MILYSKIQGTIWLNSFEGLEEILDQSIIGLTNNPPNWPKAFPFSSNIFFCAGRLHQRQPHQAADTSLAQVRGHTDSDGQHHQRLLDDGLAGTGT